MTGFAKRWIQSNLNMSRKNYKVLVVDDEGEFHRDIRIGLSGHYEFDGALNKGQMFQKLEKDLYDLLLLDLKLDHTGIQGGLALLHEVHTALPHIPIVVVTSEGEVETVMQAMELGAAYYLHKEKINYELWDKNIQNVLEKAELKKENKELKSQVRQLKEKEQAQHPFIGETAQIQEIKHSLEVVAEKRPDLTVLLTGETGVGKEVAARYLHRISPRKDKPFVGVNLSAIQKSLLESTLFGARKGGFTGATHDIKGYFEQANGGILMLDEIGDIDANIQIKLLRFLETRLIRPIGSDKDVELNVQIVAATHRDLPKAVAEGSFREDLYQRLKVMVIRIPPLRERTADIPLIVEHQLQKEGLTRDVIAPETFTCLMEYEWRGNIRELVNTVNSMVLRRDILGKKLITTDCLPLEIQQYSGGAFPGEEKEAPAVARNPPSEASNSGNHFSHQEEKALIDLHAIEQALSIKNGKKKDVALMVGCGTSDNLRYKIKTLFEQFPHLFQDFKHIRSNYPKITR